MKTLALIGFTEQVESRMYLPYGLGLLQSYVQAQAPGRYHFLAPLYRREPIVQMLPKLATAEIAAFSVYVWNIRRSLALAKALKHVQPDTLIIFGGPQVPDQAEGFLRQNPFIDVVVHGEGEQVFLQLLESQGNWSEIPGISWINADGEFITHPKGPRLKDLDQIPSPYLNGFFNPILEADPQQKWVGVWETNRGCPFSCSFCDWGSAIATKVHRFGSERLQAEMQWFAAQKIELIYCADANFGILPRDLELADMMAHVRRQHGYPRKVMVQLTKNQSARAFEAFKRLKDADLHLPATLSLQSVTPTAMTAMKRDNISLQAYQELLSQFLAEDIPTYTDMLIGLPGDDFTGLLSGIEAVMDMGQHQELRFWNVYLLPNAEMSQPEYRQRYGLQTVQTPYLDPYMPATAPLDGILESMEMIVATNTMPVTDWQRMRVLAWWTQILYHGRLLQIPLLLLKAFGGISHRELLLAFLADPLPFNTPILAYVRNFLQQRALEMSQGLPEYVLTPNGRGAQIWLPTQSFVLEQLIQSPKLPDFYTECRLVLTQLLQRTQHQLPHGLLEQALLLNERLFSVNVKARRPFELGLDYNLWSCYQQLYKGQNPTLQAGRWQLSQSPDGRGGYEMREELVARGY